MQVHQILRSKDQTGIITVTPETTVADAARLLAERRIGAVVVSRDGKKPLGILSERDIVRDLGRRGSGCLTDKVEALMTRNLISCAPNDAADSVLEKMTAGRFRHMPVMEGDAMVGFVSIGDLVAARISELAMEKDALAGMIMGN
ncbi:CBS domain-containing protein [Defluviimonas sp. WL0024]|uniref:CBS domain-containing protein n=2 Tax=Albidovulum TaxID=205889 RepID=A0ABT3J029_9RHOB|nr:MULTISPECIES: CBS domain-containing protein [Defluviimonas]MCU9849703.1 CBS domain-containing protein [Defluviimonas sp. WL0024]MCW3780790.1 CBS domain-containing protein [Defluviimonas salinarum]